MIWGYLHFRKPSNGDRDAFFQQTWLRIRIFLLEHASKRIRRQRHQGSIAFYWHSSLPFATLQTVQTLQTPFWHPQRRRQRHQGHINSFLLAFKPAVCQASNAPNPPNAFLAPPTLQAKAPRPILIVPHLPGEGC